MTDLPLSLLAHALATLWPFFAAAALTLGWILRRTGSPVMVAAVAVWALAASVMDAETLFAAAVVAWAFAALVLQ